MTTDELLSTQEAEIRTLRRQRDELIVAFENIVNHQPVIPDLVIPNSDCPECARARERNWPPSNLCSVHYSFLNKHERETENIDRLRYYDLKDIARAILTKIKESL